MDGTVGLASAVKDRAANPSLQLPKFNAGEYLSRAISELKNNSDAAYAMMNNK